MYHWFITYSLCFLLYFFDLTAILLTFRIFRDVARIECGGYLEGGGLGLPGLTFTIFLLLFSFGFVCSWSIILVLFFSFFLA